MSTSTTHTLLPLNTIEVPHLNGTTVSYLLANGPITSSKPTLVFINGYTGNAHRFHAQVHDPQLTKAATLLVIEPLGHGGTHTKAPAYTLWDAAWAIYQALEALNVKKYLVCGASSGGFIAARLALYAPEKVSSSAAKKWKVLIESRCLV
jgi:pimeloyl-ACP methyl ester carboxylesterase